VGNKGSGIKDVAARAGVSTSTVSKAFNNRTDISEPVRERILAVAAELHYVPNALIRSLRQGRSNTIGLFTWEPLDAPKLAVVAGVSRGFAHGIVEIGYDILLYSKLPNRTTSAIAATFLDGRVDGVVTVEGNIDRGGLQALADAKLPTVVMYSQDVPDGVGYVALDNAAGISAAVDHLVELGHTRIAYYAPFNTFDFRDRGNAYRARLAHHGIRPEPSLYITGEENVPGVEEACNMLLSLSSRPTALIAGNDDIANSMMIELKERGLCTPKDISIVGFDAIAQEYSIPITSICQPAVEIGAKAAQFIGAMIAGASPSECRIVLPVEFMPSQSTGPAPIM